MTQSFSATLVDRSASRSPRARAVFVPLVLATLSLASLARAQQEPASESQSVSGAPSTSPAPSAPVAPAAPLPAAVTPAPAADVPSSPPAAATSPGATTTTTTIVTTTTTGATGSAEPIEAKPARIHEGFYLRLTTGPGVLTLNGHGPYGSASLTDAGAGGMIAIGGALRPGLVLAGTLQGTVVDAKFKGGPFEDATVNYKGRTGDASDRTTAGFGMIGALVDWYPQPKGGWHLGGSTGLGAVILSNSADNSDFGGVNFAGSLFGGYDWSLGRNWSLGLQLVASGGTRTKLMVEKDGDEHDASDTGYRLTPFSVGVQASLLYF